MDVSIITAVYNNRDFIGCCIKNVVSQSYPNIEHIIVDGGSTDGTIDIIKKNSNSSVRFITGPDNGIYDALNKGIMMAKGNVIGFLHSDDLYENPLVIEKVVSYLEAFESESCYGDLLYVSRINTGKVIRYWRSGPYHDGLFHKGWMPPHPAFFALKSVYRKYGLFNTRLGSAADYELMLRFFVKHRISTTYIPEVLVRMRTGGTSNISILNRLRANRMDRKAWEINGIKPRPFIFLMKPLSKIGQFVRKYDAPMHADSPEKALKSIIQPEKKQNEK